MEAVNDLAGREERFGRFVRALLAISGRDDVITLPFPLEELAKSIGLKTTSAPFERDALDDILPRTYFIPDRERILLPQQLTANGRQFVLAHESAHWLLGSSSIQTAPESSNLWDQLSFFNRIEHPTNMLAYELLAPDFLFKHFAASRDATYVSAYFRLNLHHVLIRALLLSEVPTMVSLHLKTRPLFPLVLVKLPAANHALPAFEDDPPDDYPDGRPHIASILDKENHSSSTILSKTHLQRLREMYERLGIWQMIERALNENHKDVIHHALPTGRTWQLLPVPSSRRSVWLVYAFEGVGAARSSAFGSAPGGALCPAWYPTSRAISFVPTRKVAAWLNRIRALLGLEPRDYEFGFETEALKRPIIWVTP